MSARHREDTTYHLPLPDRSKELTVTPAERDLGRSLGGWRPLLEQTRVGTRQINCSASYEDVQQRSQATELAALYTCRWFALFLDTPVRVIPSVQRRTSKIILRLPFLCKETYLERLIKLELMPLTYWHEYLDLVFFFKCVNGLMV